MASFPPGDPTYEEGFNPEAHSNFIGTSYYLLEIVDYNKNTSNTVSYETDQQYHLNVNDVIAQIPNIPTELTTIREISKSTYKERIYFGPVKIQKLRIRLLDENGKIVNLNYGDIPICFEVESLDAPYKNMTS